LARLAQLFEIEYFFAINVYDEMRSLKFGDTRSRCTGERGSMYKDFPIYPVAAQKPVPKSLLL
jgi:hypothetical protein